MDSTKTAEQRRRLTIQQLKDRSGANSFLDVANRTESALIHGLLSNDLWDSASNFSDNPTNRIRAASTIRNLIRHNAMLAVLEELLKTHLKEPKVPFRVILISLITAMQELEDEQISVPVARLCEYLAHKLDSLQQKD